MNNPRRSIAVAHPGLMHGGSEARALWAIQALQKDYEVTLLTGLAPEWERLNAAYGTNVDPGRLQVLEAPMPRWLKSAEVGDALRGALFGRFCRQVGPRFDICVSAYNVVCFGQPGLQFIADFSWDEDLLQEYDRPSAGVRGLMRKRSPARTAYLATARLIAGGRRREAPCYPEDVIVANSRWSADQLQQRYGIKAQVVYPPVLTSTAAPSESERSADFVILGRVSPEKRIEEAIDLIAMIRERGHNVGLHIIGPLDGSAYARRIEGRAREAGQWVTLHGGVYGEDKIRLLARHGFGLHLRPREAFGIAVAEMVRAGMIPFVPARSAPAEIVADDRLTFDDLEEAVVKIDGVLEEATTQRDLRSHLRRRAERFSAAKFVSELRSLVDLSLSRARRAAKEC